MEDPFFTNPYQRTSVTVTLRMFEENLRKALYWMDGGQESGVLFERRLDVPDEVKVRARQRIQMALGVVQDLAEKLKLEVSWENAARSIKGDLFIDWENLSDIHADRLKGFGAPKEGLAEILDPPVDLLCKLALELGNLFERAATEADGRSVPAKPRDGS